MTKNKGAVSSLMEKERSVDWYNETVIMDMREEKLAVKEPLPKQIDREMNKHFKEIGWKKREIGITGLMRRDVAKAKQGVVKFIKQRHVGIQRRILEEKLGKYQMTLR